MIISCDNCSVSLQLDDAKVPKGNFTVRCPRCQNLLRVTAGSGKSAAVEQMKQNAPAPAVDGNAAQFAQKEHDLQINNALRSLLSALQTEKTTVDVSEDEEVKPRRILLCLDAAKKDFLANILAKAGYKVYAADTPAQANERLREGRTEIILFSTDFAAEFGGAGILQQKINSMPSAARRRVFLVCIDDNSTTMNAHEAFLKNLNLLINTADLDQTPMILNRALRDFNEIYRHYNKALSLEGV